MATYLDKIKEIDNGTDMVRFLNNLHFGCLQSIALGKSNKAGHYMWKRMCLSDEYRGADGCEKCKAAFWEMETDTVDGMICASLLYDTPITGIYKEDMHNETN